MPKLAVMQNLASRSQQIGPIKNILKLWNLGPKVYQQTPELTSFSRLPFWILLRTRTQTWVSTSNWKEQHLHIVLIFQSKALIQQKRLTLQIRIVWELEEKQLMPKNWAKAHRTITRSQEHLIKRFRLKAWQLYLAQWVPTSLSSQSSWWVNSLT